MANFLTLFRIFAAFPTVVAVLKGENQLALILTLLSALSDLGDGVLARRLKSANSLGRLLDPFADKVFILSVLIALVEVGRVSSVPVILLVFRDLSVSFLRGVAAIQGTVLEASQIAKVKTFLLFTAVALELAGFSFSNLVLWSAVLIAYLSVYDYIRSYLKTPSGLNYP